MAVAVVDVLEPVEVADDDGQRAAEALEACELRGQRVLALPPVRKAGETVDERLALDDPVQTRVLERDDRMRRERDRGHPVLVLEVVAEQQEGAERHVARGERNLDLVPPFAGLAGLDQLAAGRDDHASLRTRRLDRRLDDQAHQLVRVVGGA